MTQLLLYADVGHFCDNVKSYSCAGCDTCCMCAFLLRRSVRNHNWITSEYAVHADTIENTDFERLAITVYEKLQLKVVRPVPDFTDHREILLRAPKYAQLYFDLRIVSPSLRCLLQACQLGLT